jgi:hypothetical protein
LSFEASIAGAAAVDPDPAGEADAIGEADGAPIIGSPAQVVFAAWARATGAMRPKLENAESAINAIIMRRSAIEWFFTVSSCIRRRSLRLIAVDLNQTSRRHIDDLSDAFFVSPAARTIAGGSEPRPPFTIRKLVPGFGA